MTEIIVATISSVSAIVVAMIAVAGTITKAFKADIHQLREENTRQHAESSQKQDKLQDVTNNTNVRVAVIETDIGHLRSDVARNKQYVDSRRHLEH